jgi:hypothetical protein
MPVEIRELVIKTAVTATPEPGQAGQTSQTSMVGQIAPGDISKLRKEIVKEVTEEVLRILRQQTER